MMETKNIKKTAIAVAVIIAALLVYRFGEKIMTGIKLEKEIKSEVITVTVEKVAKGKFERFLKISGSVNPVDEAKVTPKLAGKITKTFRELGDTVKKGAPLFEIDPVDLKILVSQAEADYYSAKAIYEIALDDLNRIGDLYKEKIVSEQLYKSTASKERSAFYNLNSAKSRLNLARQKLGDSIVKSPFNGIVTAKLQTDGNFVSDSTPVFVVTDTKALKLTTFLSEKDISKVKEKQVIAFKTASIKDKTFYGKIKRISPRFLESSRQAEIEVEIENKEGFIKPGIFVEGEVLVEKMDEATLVPKEAVIVKNGKGVLFKAQNGAAQQVTVDILSENDIYYSIKDGIKAGDEVVVKGAPLLSSGTKISVEKAR